MAEAIRSNLSKGNLWKEVLLFAIPLAATGILQQLFNAADIAIVGRFTGEQGIAAMAAVGANAPIVGLIVNAISGISLGTSVTIANAMGRKDEKHIQKAVGSSVLFAFVGGVIAAIAGIILADWIFASQNVEPQILPLADLYFRIYMLGMPVILLYNFESAIFRGMGNTKPPLIALIFSGILNVILNLIFVVGLGRTVDGVAMATVLSNCASSLILFVILVKAHSPAKIRRKTLRIDWRMLGLILKIGVPAGLQSAVFSFANIIIQSAINSLGSIIMAASSAAYTVEAFAYYVLNAFSQACTTFVGQNYGAGRLDRCKKCFGICLLEGIIMLSASILLMVVIGKNVLGLFNPEPEVVNVGYTRLMIIFAAYYFSLVYEMASGYLRGFGISALPALITVFGICSVRLFWIFAVFPQNPTFTTIMIAYPLSLGTTAFLMVACLFLCRPAAKLRKQGWQA